MGGFLMLASMLLDLHVTLEKSSAPSGRSFGGIPRVGSGRQFGGTPRTKSRKGLIGLFRVYCESFGEGYDTSWSGL